MGEEGGRERRGVLSTTSFVKQPFLSYNENTMSKKVVAQLQDTLSSGLALQIPGFLPKEPPSSVSPSPPGCRSGRGGQGVGDRHYTLQRLPRQKHRTSAQLCYHFNHGSSGIRSRRKQGGSEVSTMAGRGVCGEPGGEDRGDGRSPSRCLREAPGFGVREVDGKYGWQLTQ